MWLGCVESLESPLFSLAVDFVVCVVDGFAVAGGLKKRIIIADVKGLLKSFLDEDKGDQSGKVLLRESRYVTDERTGVRGNQNEYQKAHPQANPESERQIFPALSSERKRNMQKVTKLRTQQLLLSYSF